MKILFIKLIALNECALRFKAMQNVGLNKKLELSVKVTDTSLGGGVGGHIFSVKKGGKSGGRTGQNDSPTCLVRV